MQFTKEQIFSALNGAIDHINSYFCEYECDAVLEPQLKGANLPFQWSLEHGVSKAVVLIKGVPYVIKLPFCCLYNEEDYDDAHYMWRRECDEALDEAREAKVKRTGDPEALLTFEEVSAALDPLRATEPDCADEEWYYPLEGATLIALKTEENAPDWDYCRLEVSIYQEALQQGLGAYFAEEGYLGSLRCGHPVYYQQRCTPFCDLHMDWDSPDYTRKSKAGRTACDKLHIPCFNSVWIADFIDYYGEDEFCRLNTFLVEMTIGDLRDCNIGYLDGAPILFDYSGFRHWD